MARKKAVDKRNAFRKEVAMEVIVWFVLMGLVRGLVFGAKQIRAQQGAERKRGMCPRCSFVHMQYGATGRNAMFCTFGGGVRAVKLDVLYCTDYRDRNAPPRLVQIGFAPGREDAKAA